MSETSCFSSADVAHNISWSVTAEQRRRRRRTRRKGTKSVERVLPTRPLIASRSNSAFLAHFCQKSGSSREMSVRLPVATKLACREKHVGWSSESLKQTASTCAQVQCDIYWWPLQKSLRITIIYSVQLLNSDGDINRYQPILMQWWKFTNYG